MIDATEVLARGATIERLAEHAAGSAAHMARGHRDAGVLGWSENDAVVETGDGTRWRVRVSVCEAGRRLRCSAPGCDATLAVASDVRVNGRMPADVREDMRRHLDEDAAHVARTKGWTPGAEPWCPEHKRAS